MHSTMKIACYSTHTVDLKNKDNTTRKLKNTKSKPKEPAGKKKSFKKDNCSAFLGGCFPMGKVLTVPSPTGGFFYIQQVDLDGWICQETITCPELSLSRQDPRSSFFLFSFFTKILSTEFQTKMYCI